MRRLAAVITAVGALVLGGCSSGTGDSARPSAASSSSSGAKVLVTGLEVPWGVTFLPSGDALVSERDSHRIVRVSPTGQVTAVGTLPGDKDDAGEGGLLGLAVSPTFASDAQVYAYYTSATDNRVVRFTYRDNTIGTITPIFTGIPSAANHDGGRIAFGPDRLLYVTTGDAAQPDRAPDPGYLGGKVLRMTAAGTPAPGNPGADSVVWTRGHRNPQGLAFAPGGALYEAEFGQNSEDEINLLEGGNDYGWPSVEGDRGRAAGATAPLKTFRTSDASPSGLAYADGSLWLAALQGKRLYRMTLTGSAVGAPQSLLDGAYGRLRTVVRAPDGSLWVTTSNRDGRGEPTAGDDRIIRIPLAA